jgi:multidrug efflux pump subunit AcrA (membrane-fusion protein)
MKTPRSRLLAGAAVVLALVVLAFVLLGRKQASTQANDGAVMAPNVPLAVARAGDVRERVDAQGHVGPPAGSSSKIGFAQAGVLRDVNVRLGERVTAGEPLADLDRGMLGAAVRSAQGDAEGASTAPSAAAKLAVAQAKLATLEARGPAALNSRIAAQSAARQADLKVVADRSTLARDEQLFTAGVIAGKDLDAARSQLTADEADQHAAAAKVAAAGADFDAALQQARADVAGARSDVHVARGAAAAARGRLEAAQITLQNGVLTSPQDGVVLSILKHPGEAVDPATPVMEIGPALGHVVTLSVSSDVARRIAVGNAVTMRVASGGVRMQGAVTAVVPAVDLATQTTSILVSGAPADAVPGDGVTASVDIGRARGILVPAGAVVEDPQTGKTVVFVRVARPKAGEAAFAMRAVTVRATDATSSIVGGALRVGETVAARGGYMLLAPAGG